MVMILDFVVVERMQVYGCQVLSWNCFCPQSFYTRLELIDSYVDFSLLSVNISFVCLVFFFAYRYAVALLLATLLAIRGEKTKNIVFGANGL